MTRLPLTAILVAATLTAGVSTRVATAHPARDGTDATCLSTVASVATVPASALPGECYAHVWMPPRYRTVTETVKVAEATEHVEVIPTQYETVNDRILVRPATEQLVQVPARHATRHETVLVQPATTAWRATDCGALGAVDAANGECRCLVTVPARYETVTRTVLLEPARTERVQLPAEYKTVQRTVVASPAREVRTMVPPRYDTVTRQVLVADGEMAWVRVACNGSSAALTADQTRVLQRALQAEGYDPGPVDGMFGSLTRAALLAYERDHGLPLGTCDATALQSLHVLP